MWLHYYNTNDSESRPIGRVRAFMHPYGFAYISGMRNYKECMKRVKTADEKGEIGFIGMYDLVGIPVFVRYFDTNNKEQYQEVGKVERVF